MKLSSFFNANIAILQLLTSDKKDRAYNIKSSIILFLIDEIRSHIERKNFEMIEFHFFFKSFRFQQNLKKESPFTISILKHR